jgi:hypothetical protein
LRRIGTLDAAREVFRAIRKIRSTDELVVKLLTKVLEGIPAKQGAVLFPDLRPPFEISGDLVAVARRENAAIWAAAKL